MRGDDRLEQEVRSVLRDLASEPAPDRLVERVASIPSTVPAAAGPAVLASGRGSFVRGATLRGLTALAAVVVLVAVAGIALVARPGGGSPVGGGPGVGGSPAPSAPSAPASVGPAASVAATGSIAPAATAGIGGHVPSGFQPVSVSFVSADVGWVLGAAPCSSGQCAWILHTTDGGATWASIPAPPAPISSDGLIPVSGLATGSGVSGLRFADAQNGWAFGPDLWATHDGGSSWQQVTIPGATSAAVVALEASAGSVHAVFYDMTGAPAVRIATSPVGRDAWAVSPTSVQIGAGPVPSTQLVLSGSSGWLLQVDRVVVGGARLSGGAWGNWNAVCSSVTGPAVLAASSPTELAAACDVGLWSTPQGERLYVSHDGGSTFAQAGTTIPLQQVESVATPSAGTVLVAGIGSQSSAMLGSFDGGRTWQTVLSFPSTNPATFTYLGFTTSSQGVAITQSGAGTGNAGRVGTGTLYMTRDGGHSWSAVVFGS